MHVNGIDALLMSSLGWKATFGTGKYTINRNSMLVNIVYVIKFSHSLSLTLSHTHLTSYFQSAISFWASITSIMPCIKWCQVNDWKIFLGFWFALINTKHIGISFAFCLNRTQKIKLSFGFSDWPTRESKKKKEIEQLEIGSNLKPWDNNFHFNSANNSRFIFFYNSVGKYWYVFDETCIDLFSFLSFENCIRHLAGSKIEVTTVPTAADRQHNRKKNSFDWNENFQCSKIAINHKSHFNYLNYPLFIITPNKPRSLIDLANGTSNIHHTCSFRSFFF